VSGDQLGKGPIPYELPMFPLGSVLLPGMALPLRVFEPRYRIMMGEVLADSPSRFGVALIERGSEVGGGDVRADVGCLAVVHSWEELPGGQLLLLATGSQRIRIEHWMPDDPFPRAMVTDWHDEPQGAPIDTARIVELTDEVRDLAGTVAELSGQHVPKDFEFSDDPAERTWQLGIVAPLGSLDRLKLLSCPGLAARVSLLAELVAEQRLLIEARRRFEEGS
jgi:uncharacterized protein